MTYIKFHIYLVFNHIKHHMKELKPKANRTTYEKQVTEKHVYEKSNASK